MHPAVDSFPVGSLPLQGAITLSLPGAEHTPNLVVRNSWSFAESLAVANIAKTTDAPNALRKKECATKRAENDALGSYVQI